MKPETTDREKFEQTILNALEAGGFASLIKGERAWFQNRLSGRSRLASQD